MANEPENTDVFVDPDTDDLDAFSDLLSGKAKETPKSEEKEEVKHEDEDLAPENDEDDDPEGDAPEEEAPLPEDKPKSKNRFQDRINDLTAKAREAERRESVLQARLAALESKQPSAAEPKATPVTVQDDIVDPNTKNQDGSDKYPLGEFDPQYIRDLTRQTIQKEQALANQAREAQDAERKTNEAKAQLQSNWETNVAPITEKYEDFYDKTVQLEDTFKNLDPEYSEYLASTIKALDNGPDVLYYLANHLDEAKRFVAAGPVMATVALGRYAAMFDKGAAETKNPVVSKAPPPPQVNKGSKARVNIPDDTDDLDAFAEKFFAKKR